MNSTAMHITDIVGGRVAGPSTPVPASTQEDARPVKAGKEAVKPGTPTEKPVPYNQDELHHAIDEINEKVQKVMREIKFSMDEKSDRVVIKVIDQSTQEVIREIPPEAVMNMVEQLDQFKGVLIKEKA